MAFYNRAFQQTIIRNTSKYYGLKFANGLESAIE